MKRLIALACILLFISCSSDNDSKSIDPVLLKKAITSYDGQPAVTADYTYDKDTLKNISYSDGRNDNYVYEEGKLIMIEEYHQGEIYKTTEFVYLGNVLPAGILKVNYSTGQVRAIEFENHSLDDFYLYYYNVSQNGDFHLTGASSLAFTRDNLMTNEIYDVAFVPTDLHTYTYDAKNNPMRNVFGNKIMVITNLDGGENNPLQIIRTGPGPSWNVTTTYTYNDDDFPLTSVKTDKDGKVITTEYLYE